LELKNVRRLRHFRPHRRLLAILTVFLGVKTVPQGYNWTVERFGRYTRMLRPKRSTVQL